jgi:hypothetical protein
MIGLWSILTVIVIIFLIHRWNPEWKSISNHDLKDFGLITIAFLLVVGFLFLARLIINKILTHK